MESLANEKHRNTESHDAQRSDEIVLTRVFDAPRSMVFDALQQARAAASAGSVPEGLVAGGLRGRPPRSAGRGASCCAAPTARTWACGVCIAKSSAPERSVHTESFDDFPGESIRDERCWSRDGGKTTLTATVLVPVAKEVRDAVIQSGMEHGAAESYDRLSELLSTTAVVSSGPVAKVM